MSDTPKKSPPAIHRRIEPGEAGERIDRWLADRLGQSRSHALALLEAGRVRLNDRTLRPSDKGVRLATGQLIEVWATELLPEPSDAPLTIAAEGEDWLIADKPAGLPVHPLRPDQRDTLLNRVVHRRPEIVGVGEAGLKSGVVHRLDLPTSGLVLFALSDERYHAARAAFANHTADKRYFALVHGHVTQPRRVELDLVVAQHRPARVAVVPPGHAAKA
ncbi:MAG: pseudouridine synthase, partial [Phycisphaeraceae bacterium]